MTQVYLEAEQKKALAAQAKKLGLKSSDMLRDAVDAAILGVNMAELRQLDEATKRAAQDLKAMVKTLDDNAAAHSVFMKEISRLRKVGA